MGGGGGDERTSSKLYTTGCQLYSFLNHDSYITLGALDYTSELIRHFYAFDVVFSMREWIRNLYPIHVAGMNQQI